MSDGFLEKEATLEQAPPAVEAPPSQEVTPRAADEAAYEQRPETGDAFLVEEGGGAGTSTGGSGQARTEAPEQQRKDEVTIEVQEILQDGLGEAFQSMPPDAKERFRAKGEEVAGEIADMVRSLRVEAKRVILLIREWLLTIPGVNKLFLEQESKIKTDRILELERERRETPPTP